MKNIPSLCVITLFALTSVSCETTNPSSPRGIDGALHSAYGAKRHGVLPAPASIASPENGVEFQVLVTSKLIETPGKQFDRHEVIPQSEYEPLVRKLTAQKGTDLMSAPSIVTRFGLDAKIEIMRELPLKSTKYNETVPLGVTMDLLPTRLKNNRIHLSGIASINELGTASTRFDESGDNHAFAIQSSDTYFTKVMSSGETILLICRDKGTAGQRIALIKVELIDPSGRRVN